MDWGTGPELGLFTFLGCLLFLIGVALVSRNRDDFSVWVHDEISMFRRNFSRFTTIGPFYGLRTESRLKALPSSFIRSFSRLPRSRINGGAILLLGGLLLFLLDLFI